MKKLLLLLLSSVLFFSCVKNEVAESTSRFMIVHAAPNTPDMEFFIDDRPILLEPLQYTSNIYYRDILSGVRNFKVKISGDVKIDTNMNFEKADVRSILFYDRPINLKMKVISDKLEGTPPGYCRARFLQMVPDATKLDVYNSLNNTPAFTNTDLGEHTEWVNLRAGTYNFNLRNSANQNSIYTDWRPDTLIAGRNYTIIANGFTNTQTSDTLGVWVISNQDF